MKWKWILAIAAVLLVAAALVLAYRQMNQERKADAERDKPMAAKSGASIGTNGEIVLTLDRETQTRIALRIEVAKAAKLKPELKGYGRVVDPAPLAALVAELETAEA